MKRVFLIHGWGGSPEEPMHKWIKKNLEERGFEVFVPKMPNPDKPEIKSWIKRIKEIVKYVNKEDIFIGHSVGCHLDEKTIEEEGEESIEIAKPWVETPINFNKIKDHCNKFIGIFSDDDPYVPLSNINIFKKNLNAEILILNKRGHFDPSHNIDKLPELLNFIK
jgi:predicted alpha/beta hydrolase family esterase